MARRKFGSIRKLPSGLFQARYIGPDGQRYSGRKLFTKDTHASLWLAKQQTAISEDKWRPPNAPRTFGEQAEQYMSTRAHRPSTVRSYNRYLDKELLPTFEKMKLTSITRAKVRAWYAKLNPETPTWRKHNYDLLRAILKDAVDAELIDQNPCYIRGASTIKPARKVKPATPEQVDALAAAMPDRLRAAVYLGAWTSLRLGEILALRRQHIVIDGPESAYVDVSENKTTGPNSIKHVGPPKTDAGERIVTIPPHVIHHLQAHLDEYVLPDEDELLFPSRDGRHMAESTFRGRWTTARKKTKLRSLTFHDLRHTGNTWAGRVGATAAELAARGGHDDTRTVARYQHGTIERDRMIARWMSEAVGWQSPSAEPGDKPIEERAGPESDTSSST